MYKKFATYPIFLLFTLYFLLSTACAVEPQLELRSSIDEKAKALQEINQKLQQTQQDLEGAEGKRKTLQNEVNQTNYRLEQLNLGIKSSKLNIEKLTLEIESLSYDIDETGYEIIIKKAGVGQMLRELQKKDNETLLVILLKNKSVAENLSELATLKELNAELSLEVDNLQILNKNLSEKLILTSKKKGDVEQENKNLGNRKFIAETQKQEKNILLTQTKNQEKNYQELIEDLEEQQEVIASEIEKLETELRAKIDPSFLPDPRPGLLAHPLPSSLLKQDYGATAFAKYGYRGKWHNGLDFGGVPIGTPILASEDGEVIATGDQDNYLTNGKKLCYRGAYGKFIVIKHKNNLTTMYAHLSLISVEIGDSVKREQVIGYVGNTGYSTGPHLHFTVYSTQTIPPATPGFPEGTRSSRVCGPLPVGGDINPRQYLKL